MIHVNEVGGLFEALPPTLQTDDYEALAYCIDRQFAKLLSLGEKLNLWSNLDNADPRHYDMIAMSLSTPYYRSEMDDEKKLEMIKTTPQAHKYAGTVKGVTMLLDSMFDESGYEAWYEYGGRPYHFKVQASDPRSMDIEKRFEEMLQKVKAARSQLDSIETVRETGHEVYLGLEETAVYIAPPIEEAD